MVVFRKLITPDGTELISNHRHDYIAYQDKNGKTYMLDGGHLGSYFRMSTNGDEKIVEITTEHTFDIIRANFGRWNRYISKYVRLKDMSDTWIQNVIDWYIEHGYLQTPYLPLLRLYLEEKIYRAENEITITDDQMDNLALAA